MSEGYIVLPHPTTKRMLGAEIFVHHFFVYTDFLYILISTEIILKRSKRRSILDNHGQNLFREENNYGIYITGLQFPCQVLYYISVREYIIDKHAF